MSPGCLAPAPSAPGVRASGWRPGAWTQRPGPPPLVSPTGYPGTWCQTHWGFPGRCDVPGVPRPRSHEARERVCRAGAPGAGTRAPAPPCLPHGLPGDMVPVSLGIPGAARCPRGAQPPPQTTPARGAVGRTLARGARGAWAGQGGGPLAGLPEGPGPGGGRWPGCRGGWPAPRVASRTWAARGGQQLSAWGPSLSARWLGKPRQSTIAQVFPNGGAVGFCPTIGGRGTATPLGEPIKKACASS